MTGMIPARAAKWAAAILAATAAVAVAAGPASAEVVYNNIPSPLPGNLPSLGFEATQTSEFGGQVEFAGTTRSNPRVTVTMSSWGCQSGSWTNDTCVTTPGATFQWPITLNIYEVGAGNAPGSKIGTVTHTFAMPYRPSANDKRCTGPSLGKWFHKGECFNGKAFKITFNVKGVKLPANAIISVAYNTSDYGAEPQRPKPCDASTAGCFYDSLNVAIREASEPGPSVGKDPAPADAYVNSKNLELYCANPGGLGTFAISKGCWTGEQPAIKVSAAGRGENEEVQEESAQD